MSPRGITKGQWVKKKSDWNEFFINIFLATRSDCLKNLDIPCWYVQNSVVIISLEFGLKAKVLIIKYELREEEFSDMDPDQINTRKL